MATRLGIHWTSVRIMALSCVCILTMSGELYAARYVPAEIRLDGKVILKGNASDDGERDADELWRALPNVKFRLTPDGEKWAAKADTEQRLLEGEIVLRLTFSGIVETTYLRVTRSPKEEGDVHWKVDPADVKRLFLSRSIPRKSVSSLKDINARE